MSRRARSRASSGSLRSRLVVVVLALTSLGLVLAAMAGTLLLRQHLMAQVDEQLAGANRFATLGAPPPPQSDQNQRGALPSPFVLTTLDASGTVVTQRRVRGLTGSPQRCMAAIMPCCVSAVNADISPHA